MSQQQQNSSLLSLSIAAANAAPIPILHQTGTQAKHHRRLSSTGKARRRLSDARDAANRPSPATLQSSTAALSLASLSLSSSPPSANHHLSTSLNAATNSLANEPAQLNSAEGAAFPHTVHLESAGNDSSNGNGNTPNAATPIPIANGKNRKRGMDHKCESCSKIYRHPSCLIKHRWEHTPHWREASKYVLSKHQQVQLLEAAAILSHLSPSSSSLPEDRSLWPSFLSGGSLPPPENIAVAAYAATAYQNNVATSYGASYTHNPGFSPTSTSFATTVLNNRPTSSSVPTMGTSYYRSTSSTFSMTGAGPKHLAPATSIAGLTQVHAGSLDTPSALNEDKRGVATPTPAAPLSASLPTTTPAVMEEEEDSSKRETNQKGVAANDDLLSSLDSRSRSRSGSGSVSASGFGSGSRSRSASISEEEEDDNDDDGPYSNVNEKMWRGFAGGRRLGGNDSDIGSEGEEDQNNVARSWGGRKGPQKEEGGSQVEWDGMEMDMDMD
ncbi:hypothetical protein AX17_005626 [Amanita inopinata Kibby_2008]|nr:hypothetical protein AX17_005626 [Amanita inopinata Kibby_2008]